ncbi:N utilization substance protein B [Sulfuriferula sp. AH1]|uniref:transcription antitermination factor NusB n=1 Tax=Sulfuriferula sp. AH1 TaxID=1985873 RepID=UPI000B3BAB7C|nr:transcription antitermination factor NusB [Sulfuriferula sp. AH1]ARU30957.1 N utilization substance protein B [Sulfuriferula sp. AH1]
MSGNRRKAREFAVQGIYQWLLNQQPVSDVVKQLRDDPGYAGIDEKMFLALLNGAINETAQLDQRLAKYVDRPIAELSPVEHAVLLLGAQELLHHLEVPYRVVINEAVELTKTFGGTDGHKYVNGVMDKLAAEVRSVEVNKPRR